LVTFYLGVDTSGEGGRDLVSRDRSLVSRDRCLVGRHRGLVSRDRGLDEWRQRFRIEKLGLDVSRGYRGLVSSADT
jgi:hypothetical protein